MTAAEHLVQVQPAGVEFTVPEGEPVMRAAQRLNLRWPNVCGGEAMCGVCFVRVLEGAEHTSEMKREERFRLDFVGKGKDDTARLACQLRITGPVALFKRGVRQV